MKIFSVRFLLLLSVLVVLGTLGPNWAEASSETLPTNLTPAQWTGQNFTFLALSADQQAAGYEVFTLDQADQGFQGDRSVRIAYAEHVGKEVTITQMVTFPAGKNKSESLAYMTVNDTGEKLVSRTARGQLEGLVLTSDIVNARQQFLGKVIYPKSRELSGLDASGTDAPVAISIGSAVTVVDVYSGNQSQQPICLIVSVNGQKAVLPIAYSWTNTSVNTWRPTAAWQDAFFTEDPRLTLGWSQTMWNNIENGNVENGMTKAQIRLSWGNPVRVDENNAVWTYGPKKLNFSGEVLQSIETIE
jgi:hypothetical protein